MTGIGNNWGLHDHLEIICQHAEKEPYKNYEYRIYLHDTCTDFRSENWTLKKKNAPISTLYIDYFIIVRIFTKNYKSHYSNHWGD